MIESFTKKTSAEPSNETIIQITNDEANKCDPPPTTAPILCAIAIMLIFSASIGLCCILRHSCNQSIISIDQDTCNSKIKEAYWLSLSTAVAMLIASITGIISILSRKYRQYLYWTNIIMYSLILVGLNASLSCWLNLFGHGFTPALLGLCLALCPIPIYVNASFIKGKVTEPRVPTGTIIVSVLCGLIYLSFFLLGICLCTIGAILVRYTWAELVDLWKKPLTGHLFDRNFGKNKRLAPFAIMAMLEYAGPEIVRSSCLSFGVAMSIASITGFISILSRKCCRSLCLQCANAVLFSLIIVGLLVVSFFFWFHFRGDGFYISVFFGIGSLLCLIPLCVSVCNAISARRVRPYHVTH